MREIRTSGSMSGQGRRGLDYRVPARLYLIAPALGRSIKGSVAADMVVARIEEAGRCVQLGLTLAHHPSPVNLDL
jgi:hypothetical protein